MNVTGSGLCVGKELNLLWCYSPYGTADLQIIALYVVFINVDRVKVMPDFARDGVLMTQKVEQEVTRRANTGCCEQSQSLCLKDGNWKDEVSPEPWERGQGSKANSTRNPFIRQSDITK